MSDKCAVINCGSSSIKLEVFAVPGLKSIAEGLLEKIGTAESHLKRRRVMHDGSVHEEVHNRAIADHRVGFDFILEVKPATASSVTLPRSPRLDIGWCMAATVSPCRPWSMIT